MQWHLHVESSAVEVQSTDCSAAEPVAVDSCSVLEEQSQHWDEKTCYTCDQEDIDGDESIYQRHVQVDYSKYIKAVVWDDSVSCCE